MRTMIFDLDDTLIHNNSFFLLSRLALAEYIIRKKKAGQSELEAIAGLKIHLVKNSNFSHDLSRLAMQEYGEQAAGIQEVLDIQESIDIGYVANEGFSIERYPHSFRQTLTFFSNKYGFRCLESDYLCVESIARQAFAIYPSLIDGAANVLDFLANKGNELLLLTKGDICLQQRKIEINELDFWFSNDKIHIVPEKTIETFKRVSDGRNRNECYSIGNSPGSDIAPAIAAGCMAIYIPFPTWKYENSMHCPLSSRVITVNSIKDIPLIYDTLP